MIYKQTLFYPIAAASNLFSVTALLIIAGILGNGELAADIAIVQAAVVAIFLSLSGNARNLILANNTDSDDKSLFYFRLITMLPAAVAVFYLTRSTIEVPAYLVVGLTLRKCSEWVAELQLANKEKRDDFLFAYRYIQINVVGFFALVVTLLVPSWFESFGITLYVWAVLPLAFLRSYIRSINGLKQFKVNLMPLMPHLGSSTIIGVSMYVFRILIVILIGKSLAGQMFTAYALGGVVSTLYTFALGPSLVRNEGAGKVKALLVPVIICIFVGSLVVSSTLIFDINLYSPRFLLSIGFSLIGGGVMLIAQQQRLYLLQFRKKDVFVPDALANILLIATIPFAFFLFGAPSVVLFYLWSATLHLLFYVPLAYKSSTAIA